MPAALDEGRLIEMEQRLRKLDDVLEMALLYVASAERNDYPMWKREKAGAVRLDLEELTEGHAADFRQLLEHVRRCAL